jgi:hypothetical protein
MCLIGAGIACKERNFSEQYQDKDWPSNIHLYQTNN